MHHSGLQGERTHQKTTPTDNLNHIPPLFLFLLFFLLLGLGLPVIFLHSDFFFPSNEPAAAAADSTTNKNKDEY
jgi:hypothetical protein